MPSPSTDLEASSTDPVVLFVTVGGSPQPIISAMRALRPKAVWFVVSEVTEHAKSSSDQVESAAIVIDRKSGEIGPGLRRQPDCPTDVRVCRVPADKPDLTFARCIEWMREAQRRFPQHRLVADYTGGTKSMTGGLLMAALALEGVEVQIISGNRPDLDQVETGTEAPRAVSSDAVLADREMRRIESVVAQYDYAAASDLAADLKRRAGTSRGIPKSSRTRIAKVAAVLAILKEWDAFRHGEAASRGRDDRAPDGAARRTFEELGLLAPLQKLAEAGREQSSWPLCADVWLNAQRCAARARYDDAVARLYRLTEAAVQAQLWLRHQVPNPPQWDQVPEDLRKDLEPIRAIHNGKGYQAAGLGLDRCIQMLCRLDPLDPLVVALTEGGARSGRPPWTNRRNNSILAHGFSSLDENAWKTASAWVAERLRPFWESVEPPQLPCDLRFAE